MTTDPDLDLTLQRVIKASRAAIWSAWTDPVKLAQWWLPAPLRCRVDAFEPRPGGAFVTRMSEDGGDFVPHVSGCFLDVRQDERLVFTNALVAGWRPAEGGFMTAVITLADHADGTFYDVVVKHKDRADRDRHEEMGFHDGWGTVTTQMAALVEG